MKKYLLPSALILAFGIALAYAQTINKAVQLSQDTTGAFSVDTNNNVYLPGHVLSTGPGATVSGGQTPTLVCGTGTPSVVGTDTSGIVTEGTSTTSCALIFAKAYLQTPACVVVPQSIAALTPFQFTQATQVITWTHGSASGTLINYWCSGQK